MATLTDRFKQLVNTNAIKQQPTATASALDYQNRIYAEQARRDREELVSQEAYRTRMATDPQFAEDEAARARLDLDTKRKNELAAKIVVNQRATVAVVNEHAKLLLIYSTEALAAVLARDEKLRTHLALALTLAPAFTPEEPC